MAHADYIAAANASSQLVLDYIEIDLPYSGGTGSQGNTFRIGTEHSVPVAKRLGVNMSPYLISAGGGSTTRIKPGLQTDRASITISVKDDENPADFDAAVVELTSGSSFWRRLFVAYPNWHRSPVRVYSFFDTADLDDLSKAELMFSGVLEDYRFNADKTVSLIVRDPLEFKDMKVPTPISTDNDLNVAITTTTQTTVTPDDDSEFVDPPNDWPSVDFLPPLVKIDNELIAYYGVSAGALQVARNYAYWSSTFANAVWFKQVGATVFDNQRLGPYGWVDAAELTCPQNGSCWQVSALAATSQNANASIWVHEHPDNPGAAFNLVIWDSGTVTEIASIAITAAPYWVRYDVPKAFTGAAGGNVAFGVNRLVAPTAKIYIAAGQVVPALAKENYVPTQATPGAAIGRGAYGTTAATHSVGADITTQIEYREPFTTANGLHPIYCKRDLCNRLQIPTALVDDAAWGVELSFSQGDRARRTLAEPHDGKKLVKELREQFLVDIWVGRDGLLKCRWSWRTRFATESLPKLTHARDLMAPPLSNSGKESRLTEIPIYYDFSGDSEGRSDVPDQYDTWVIFRNKDAEGPDNRSRKVQEIYSRWIYQGAEASSLWGRMKQRRLDGMRRIERLPVTYTRFGDFDVGDVVQLDTPWIVRDLSGAAANDDLTGWQVVAMKYRGLADDFEVSLLEHVTTRPAFFAPNNDLESPANPFPDYDNASDAERFYAFFCTNSGTVGTDQDPPYLFQ